MMKKRESSLGEQSMEEAGFCRGLRRVIEEESSREFSINDDGVLRAISDDDDDDDDSSLFSLNISDDKDWVYVCVGKKESSMEALRWTLEHASAPTVIYLVHVFPVIRLIPSPLGGKLPKSQANPKVVETYLAQQRDKRKKLLNKYIHACSPSNVTVQTIEVESDCVSKTVLELIPTLNIKRLVLGSTKPTLTSTKLTQILRNAPQTCEVDIISRGKRVNDQLRWSPSPSPRDSCASSDHEQLPELIRSRSESGVGSLNLWNQVKWVLIKPSRRPDQR